MQWLLAGLLLAGPSPEGLQAKEHLREGQHLLSKERFEDAATQFREAIRLDRLLMMAHYGLGQAHMALKQYPAAVVAFTGAREAFHRRVALSVDRQLDDESARQDRMRDLRDKIRQNLERSVAPGSAAARQRDLRVQQWEVELAMLDRPRDSHEIPVIPAGLSLALGSAHFRSGQLADAEREYRAAVAVQSKLGEPRNNLAVVLLLTGRAAEAKEQVGLAEKYGFHVAPGLKEDVEKALARASGAAPN